MTCSNRSEIIHSGVNKYRIIAFPSNQTGARGFTEGNSKLDPRNRTHQSLVKIFNGLDEMRLPKNYVALSWNVDPDGFEIQSTTPFSSNFRIARQIFPQAE